MIRLLTALVVLCLMISCSFEKREEVVPFAEQDYPDQESWDATIYITRMGRVVGFLKAGHIQKYSQKNLTFLQDSITVDFYNEQGEHTSVLTAWGGKVYDQTQDMLAFGNVVVVSDSGVTLFTDTLKWDNERQKIVSEIPITIATETGDTLYGDSFISDTNLQNREITNPRGRSSKRIELD